MKTGTPFMKRILEGPWVLAQTVIKHRINDGKPCSIINIASVLGVRPLGHIPPYAAAKAGMINLGSRSLCRFSFKRN